MDSSIPSGIVADIAATQTLLGKERPAKMIISTCANSLSNYAGQREFLDKIIPNIDYWVVIDLEMTDSARYADLVLPATSWYEVEDVRVCYCIPYTVYQEKAIEPLYEAKRDYEIAELVGRKLGYDEYFPQDWGFDEWCNLLFDSDTAREKGVTLENLREKKFVRTITEDGVPDVRGYTQPLPTEHGRAMLYTETAAPRVVYGQALVDGEDRNHLVYYRPPAEADRDNPLFEKYPLVFLQEHARYRVHSQWYQLEMLRELDPEPLAKVSAVDAEERGVKSGDIVEVYNDRGHAVLKCVIDTSIPSGVLSIPKGWQRNQFIDGCFQELTNPKMDTDASVFPFYDSLVNFKKWGE